MMKELKEIHKIMEKIYAEERLLNAEERVKKIKEEADKFMMERKMSLKRANPKELKSIPA